MASLPEHGQTGVSMSRSTHVIDSEFTRSHPQHRSIPFQSTGSVRASYITLRKLLSYKENGVIKMSPNLGSGTDTFKIKGLPV